MEAIRVVLERVVAELGTIPLSKCVGDPDAQGLFCQACQKQTSGDGELLVHEGDCLAFRAAEALAAITTTTAATQYEPPPKRTDGPAIWDLVIADMKARDGEGRRKYGTPLQAWNGRRALVDAYQEVLDLAVYLRQEIEERGGRQRERFSDASPTFERQVMGAWLPDYGDDGKCTKCRGAIADHVHDPTPVRVGAHVMMGGSFKCPTAVRR